MQTQCSEPDCSKPLRTCGLCNMHYLRLWKHGTTTPPPPPSPLERLLDRIDFTESCWLWTGTTNGVGYGLLSSNNKKVYAHRFSYEWFVGPIPAGLTLDHLCRVTRCVNPDHLEPVTNRENILRGTGFAAKNSVKTHCPQGHLYDEENTYHHPNGDGRKCRACARQVQKERRRRVSAARSG